MTGAPLIAVRLHHSPDMADAWLRFGRFAAERHRGRLPVRPRRLTRQRLWHDPLDVLLAAHRYAQRADRHDRRPMVRTC